MEILAINEQGADKPDNHLIHEESLRICLTLQGLNIDLGLNILFSCLLNTALENDYPGVRENVVKNLRALADVIESGDFSKTATLFH